MKRVPKTQLAVEPIFDEEITRELRLARRREMFIQEYMKDWNGTRAAKAVGYSDVGSAVEASRMLKDPNVLARIRQLQAERSARLSISADFVLEGLIRIYDRCMQAEQVYEWVDGQKVPTGEWTFDSRGAAKAMELIGKHLAMFTEKIEHSVHANFGDRLRDAHARLERAKQDKQQGPLPRTIEAERKTVQ